MHRRRNVELDKIEVADRCGSYTGRRTVNDCLRLKFENTLNEIRGVHHVDRLLHDIGRDLKKVWSWRAHKQANLHVWVFGRQLLHDIEAQGPRGSSHQNTLQIERNRTSSTITLPSR